MVPAGHFFLLYIQRENERCRCLSPNQTKNLGFHSDRTNLDYILMAMGSKLIRNSVLRSGIRGKGSIILKVQNDGGGRKVIRTDVASQSTKRAIHQAFQFCMVPEKEDIPSSKCFPCFLNRIILEAFTM